MGGINGFTQLMLHCNGVDGSTTFTDVMGHSVTAGGTAQIDTSQSKFGGASGQFDGSSSCALTMAAYSGIDFGSGNFTIDFWLRPTTTGGTVAILSQWAGGGSGGSFYIDWQNGGLIAFYWSTGGGESAHQSTIQIVINTWQHIAIMRSGNTLYFFKDGVLSGTADMTGVTIPTSSLDFHISTYNGTDQSMSAWIDEIRIQKGEAYFNTAGFTPETGEYTNGDDTETPAILTAASSVFAPSVVINKTVTPSILTAVSSVIAPGAIGVQTTVSPSILTALSSLVTPSVVISSTVIPSILSAASSVLAPTTPGLSNAKNASRILSFNPLVIVTNTNPVKVVRVDITDPVNPSYTTYEIPTAVGAQDVAYNATFNKIYVACQTGKIIELDSTNFASNSVINTGITADLKNIASLDAFDDVYAGSNYSLGEVVDMFEGNAQMVDTDIRWSGTVRNTIDTTINTVNGARMDTDIRFSATSRTNVGFDIRFHTAPYDQIPYNPIARTDFHVWVDGVELTDVRLDTIQITHTEGEKSRATFILARRHDKLNYRLDGVASQITNRNHVQIYIQSNLEFDGYVWDLDCRSETETVQITAYTSLPKVDERSTVTISIPGVNEKLHVYHALIHNPKVNNPFILPDDLNPPFFTGIHVDMGYDETQNISRFQFFGDTTQLAQDVGTKGAFKPKQNWTYFWFAKAQNFITGSLWATLNYLGTSPTSLTADTWQITGMSYYYQRQFKNTRIRLGDGKVYENDFKYITLASPTYIYVALQGSGYLDGSGNITQKFKDTDKGFINRASGLSEGFVLSVTGSSKSSSSLLNDVWDIVNGKLGYFVGTAPYKKVSAKAGRLTTKDKWLDQPDGLYRSRDEAFDFRDYAKQIAALEFKKIENINGAMLPQTSAEVELFIDGYYYFGISLLKRINIDNTTELGIYTNANGFPVSVKTIDINSQTMKVTMRCDNQWSRQELLEIESTYPNPEDILFVTPEQLVQVGAKFDPNTFGYVQ